MYNPIATYRIQLHEGFNLQALEAILPYLRDLGIRTIYAAPIFASTPGSTHGYDAVQVQFVNESLGHEDHLLAISRQLQEWGMGWLQDIVPNHMAFHPDNAWLMDVLEQGPNATYATYFDIDWENPACPGRLMVPFLGQPLEDVIAAGELKLILKDGRLMLDYMGQHYPLRPESYALALNESQMPENLRQVLNEAGRFTEISEAGVWRQAFASWRQSWRALLAQEEVAALVQTAIDQIHNRPQQLQALAEAQHYRLSYWMETDSSINFRRFFTVNGLIGLKIENQEVFDQYHQLAGRLLRQGVFQGLRVDHIDGLADPASYLNKLRALAGPDTYLVVEKILEPGEEPPAEWPIQGTTGYDFLALVNNLFSCRKYESDFTRFYQKLVQNDRPVHEQAREKKALILHDYMAGELQNLVSRIERYELAAPEELDALEPGQLQDALAALLVHCPVYRFYGSSMPLPTAEASRLSALFQELRKSHSGLEPALNLLEAIWLKRTGQGDAGYDHRALDCYQRCMQLSGPLMAKGVEDTLMYTFNRFIGHNEVGNDPALFGLDVADFHEQMIQRQQHWPLSMNTLATHDTKRGADARARLNALTALGPDWLKQVKSWLEAHEPLRAAGVPDHNDAYLVYQTLIATYPMPGTDAAGYEERLSEYLVKAMREAKTHSSWSQPNEAYEQTVCDFAKKLLDPRQDFWHPFHDWLHRVAGHGIINSLSQMVLQCTCPGLPDIYQGAEFWDLSLVDPDNRRPVDYELRQNRLQELASTHPDDMDAFLKELWNRRADGSLKLWLMHRLLQLRAQYADLFAEGAYLPLELAGPHKESVIAFARHRGDEWLLVVVPLFPALLFGDDENIETDWEETRIILPAGAPVNWQSLLDGRKGKAGKGIYLKDLFGALPLGVLRLERSKDGRSAGILLAISSLPSAFGVGDLGPCAREFADYLSRSRQRYWQLLPLNPTDAGSGHSPYSSHSGMAGNPILMSPEQLIEDGLLEATDLEPYRQEVRDQADYEAAAQVRSKLFELAYSRFDAERFPELYQAYEQFCRQEASWLDDHALYTVIRKREDAPWYEWPDALKRRQPEALEQIRQDAAGELGMARWLQFVFYRQWMGLKAYCHERGVQLLGDLPFYMSHDSADVWASPELFSLDVHGGIKGIAGVPPDYFSEDGQLWGMPTYRWELMRARGYDWWARRLAKNLELFDLLRLDHFRAFESYWEVPAGSEIAREGQWRPGPGVPFFDAMRRKLGPLPFVAEDLGDNMDAVYVLRDKLGLPGMRVLQFAFGENMPDSVDIPHQYPVNAIVYTGTHDNNTTRGWYRKDCSSADRKRLEQYVGHKVDEEDVAKVLARLGYASVARTVIIPMQDVLALDEDARMNMPGTGQNNWLWRMFPDQLRDGHEKQLRKWTMIYNRM